MRITTFTTQPADAAEWPAEGEVHLYQLALDQPWDDLAKLKHFLDEFEIQRMDRYTVEKAKRDFSVTRACLRIILMSYLRTSDFVITPSPSGKPEVPGSGLHFNVSHSGDVGLIALARQQVGVDVEQLRAMPNAEGLVKRFFSREEAEQFERLPAEHRVAGFFKAWTEKEALLKAVGVGLSDLESCVVDLDPREPERIVRFDHPGQWEVKTFAVSDGYLATIAMS